MVDSSYWEPPRREVADLRDQFHYPDQGHEGEVCHEVYRERVREYPSESRRGCRHSNTPYYLVVGCSSWCWTDRSWDNHTPFPSASRSQHAMNRDPSCRFAHGADTNSCGPQIHRRMRVASRRLRLARWSHPLQLPADVSTELKKMPRDISHWPQRSSVTTVGSLDSTILPAIKSLVTARYTIQG